jgi:uncharacterized protein (DUF697 family)
MSDSPPVLEPEPVLPMAPQRLQHLQKHRRLILRRSLLATALGGFIPVPLMDDYLAARVRAGLFMNLGRGHGVDLPASAAEVLGEAEGASTLRNATITAITLVALKLAWKKFFFLLAAGRGAEEMAEAFQVATLVDHYCARLHVGGALTREQAGAIRRAAFAATAATERSALVAAFREGAGILGRSLLEAPRWVTDRLGAIGQRFARSGGNADVDERLRAEATQDDLADARFVDRAADTVERRVADLGQDYLTALVTAFEQRLSAEAARPAPTPPSPDRRD